MSYSSTPYYSRTHGGGGGGGGGAYGKPSASTGGTTERPATLNLGKASGGSGTGTGANSSSRTQHAQQQQQHQQRYEEITSKTSSSSSTSTSNLFPTMGSSMIFPPKPSRYANPTVPPLKSTSQAPTTSQGQGSSTSTYSASMLAASTTSNLLAAAASSSSKLQYLSDKTTLEKQSRQSTQTQYQHQHQHQQRADESQSKAPVVQLSSISKPFTSTAGCNIPQPYQPISSVAPKSAFSSVGYGRTSIPYYQSKLTSSNQNLIVADSATMAGVPSPSPVQTYGHAMHMTMNPLCKSAGSTNLSTLGSTSVYGGGGGGSTQNLNNVGLKVPTSTNISSVSNIGGGMQGSKSSNHLLVDSIPNVFCLSCPPAEFKFSDAYRAKTLPRSGKENERLIGFATLPEQVHRKSVKKGFDFTLMAVGESGLGKSTLINSLFLADFYQNRKVPSVNEQVKRTTTIQKHTIEIEERGVKLRLTVVDTPGFGDAINCEESWKTCVEYIDEQFNQYFQAESGLNRRHIQDSRVHCCLYFVPPYGRGLRELDLEVMRNLQNRVNVIPIIAKADTLTQFEVKRMKDQIMQDLKSNMISIYQFPDCDEEEDEEFKKQDRELKAAIPFAVASSLTFVDGKRARQYPWGTVEIENPSHSDFGKLRTMLIQSHMHDLKETTQDLHYENFRAKAIAQISQGRNARERTKLKRDSSMDSPQELLMQKEAEIKKMQQMISKMEAKLKAQSYKPPPPPPHSRDSVIDL